MEKLKLPKFHWAKLLSVFFFVLLLGAYASTFAIGQKYTPGATLDPACPPGEENCTVDIGGGSTDILGTYIVQTATNAPANAQLLSALTTGIVKNTTTTGVLSIAVNSDLPVMSATVSGAVPTPPNNTTTFLRGDGTFATPTGGGTPAGSNTEIQFNNNGTFNGSTGFTWVEGSNGDPFSIGADVTLTKADNEVASTPPPPVDEISSFVTLKRDDTKGLYNATSESSYDQWSRVSPAGTEWNSLGWGDLSDVSTRTYVSFYDALGRVGDNIIGSELVMHDIGADKYYKFEFTFWSSSRNGQNGGFEYIRSLINLAPYSLGAEVTFTRPDSATPSDEISSFVHITRGTSKGIYNTVSESTYDDSSYVSPAGTEWNSLGWGDLTDVDTRTYVSFYDALGQRIGDNIIGSELVMHDIGADKYYKFSFSDWTADGGGGFSYTRNLITLSTSVSSLLTASGNISIGGENQYLNFGTTNGSSGYGFRDKGGLMQYKNSGEDWTPFGLSSDADFNTKGGTNAGLNLVSGAQNNTFLGYEAGKGGVVTNAADNNTAIGYQSLYSNTTGYRNTANGYKSLYSNTTGYYNTANGISSLYSNTTGTDNTANGNQSLYSNTTGNQNTANGSYSLLWNTTGNQNTANGYSSLYSNTTGNYNTAFGLNSLSGNTTGSSNTANGSYSLSANTTGYFNTANGYSSLQYNTTGSNNTALGYQSGVYAGSGYTANRTSNNSLYLGYDTRASADGNTNEIVVGYGTLGKGSNTATIGNTFTLRTYLTGLNLKAGTATAGTAPLKFTSSAGALLSPTEAGAVEFDGTHLYFTAVDSGTRFQLDQQSGGGGLSSDADYNTKGGTSAGLNLVSGAQYNTFLGYEAGKSGAGTTNAADNNTAIGYKSLFSNTTGYQNTANGSFSLYSNTTGNDNTANGYQSLSSNTTGNNNTANGYYSLNSNATGSSNTANGFSSLSSNTTGYNNTANGSQSLFFNTTGFSNTALGFQSGVYAGSGYTANTTSNNSLYLGYDTRPSADGNTNEIVVGYGTIGNGSNTTTIGNTSTLRTYLTGLNLKAGTATAGTAPLKFTSGSLLGTTEAGAVEFLTDAYYGTITTGAGTAGARKTFAFLESPSFTTPSLGVATGTSLDLSGTIETGANSGTNGQLTLYGSTSGSVALKANIAAGTGTIFQLPANNGSNTNILQTDGSGVTSWVALPASGLTVGTTAIASGTTGRVLYDNAGVLGEMTTSGTGTVLALATTPTFTTNITTPLVLGGSSTTSPLTFQTTSGVGTTGADMHFKVGNAGATEAMTILNNGNVGIGTTGPAATLDINGNGIANSLNIINSTSQTTATTYGLSNYLTQTTGNSAHQTIGAFNSTTYSGSGNESIVYGIKNYAYLNTVGTVSSSFGDRTAVFNNGAVLTNGEGIEGSVINNSGTLTTGYGVIGNVTIGAGKFNKIVGVYSNVTNASSDITNGDPYGFYSSFHNTGIVDGFAGFQVDANNTGTARIMNGLQVDFYTAGGTTQELRGIDLGHTHPWTGTPTNSYGIYIDASTNIGTSTNYSIYSASTANSYFAGNVGIGTTATTYTLQVGSSSVTGIVARFTNSAGYCDINPLTTALVCTSDINLKKNITTLNGEDFILNTEIDSKDKGTLEKIISLNPVTYNWNTEEDSTGKHIGFIAQEMEQVFPDLVFTDSVTGLKSVAFTNLIPYTVEAIKEMDLKVKDLSSLDTESATSLGSLIKDFLANASNNIAVVFFGEVHTKKLCLDDLCITKDQLQQILDSNSVNPSNTNVESSSTSDVVDDSTTNANTATADAEVGVSAMGNEETNTTVTTSTINTNEDVKTNETKTTNEDTTTPSSIDSTQSNLTSDVIE